MLSGTHLRCHTSSITAACTRPKLACSTYSRTHRRPATRCVDGQGAHIACASASHADDSTAPASQQQQQQQQPEQLASPSEPLQQQAQSQQINRPVQTQQQQQQQQDGQQELLLPPVTQGSSQQAAAHQQQKGGPQWGWDAWLDHFEGQDELGSQLDDACLELEAAVAQEDYAAAAELKRSILSLLAQDAVAEVNRSIQDALQAEDYSTVARLRNEGGAWLEGWWTCTDKKDGQLLRIAPEYGRWTARVYTAKDLAVIKGLVDEETATELLEQIPTNQQVAAAAAATARVVASLRGQQQQSKGHEQLQRALLLLGTPEMEVFVRPTGDTRADVQHAHGSSSSSGGRDTDSNGSTVTQNSSREGSSANLRHGLTEREQQQQQQYEMQAVGLGSIQHKYVAASLLDFPAEMSKFHLAVTSGQMRISMTTGPRGEDGELLNNDDASDDEESDGEDSDGEGGDAEDSDGEHSTGLDSDGEDSDGEDSDREGSDGEGNDGEGGGGYTPISFAAQVQAAAQSERWPLLITAHSKDTMCTSPAKAVEFVKAALDRSYRRLTMHTSSSTGSVSSSSSSSSDPLQGYFLGPAYLDREDPQLLLLQMGRCPDSNKPMLLGTTVTGSDEQYEERPARHLFMRADVSPQSDPLPVELFPSKLGVISRHPAEVRFRDQETWDHAELLQLKQGRVRNEMTDGAQLGLLWKPEGSSKHVMVLLHSVVLEEL